MGISLAKLGVTKDRKAVVEFDGGNINVTYDATKMNAAAMNAINASVDEEDYTAAAQVFVSVITSWDLTGPLGEGEHEVAEDEVIPLTPEHVSYVPYPILGAIIESVAEDANPNSKKKRRK